MLMTMSLKMRLKNLLIGVNNLISINMLAIGIYKAQAILTKIIIMIK